MPSIVLVLGDISDSTVTDIFYKCDQRIKMPKVVRMSFDEIFPKGDAKVTLSLQRIDLLIMEHSDWEELKSKTRRPAYNTFYQKYQPEIWAQLTSGRVFPIIF